MKVVIPVADLHIGGGCKVLVEVAQALQSRGHEVEIVMPKGGRVHYPLPCPLKLIPSLSEEYIPYGDIVLPNFYTTFAPAYKAWPDQCVRLSLGFEPYWVRDKQQAHWTYRQGVPVISISRWLDDQIYKHAKVRTTVINPGIDPEIYFPAADQHRNSNRTKTILYIARDPAAGYELKGFNDFAASLHCLKKIWDGNFFVHMICPGGEVPLPGIPHRKFFPKSEKQMADLYRTADLFVSSSWFEAFSLPPLEAMACGTPVVTTNSGGVLDFCTHMVSSYVVRPKDPPSLAKGIMNVLSDENLETRLVKGGYQAASPLTKTQFMQRVGEILEELNRKLKTNKRKKS
jgi:glycosyltransferase involved in cell wall biosynthesis